MSLFDIGIHEEAEIDINNTFDWYYNIQPKLAHKFKHQPIKPVNHIIFFDGDCNFCNFLVRFILKRDKKRVFKFAKLSSEMGSNIKQQYLLAESIDSIVLLKNNQIYIKSAAALEIAKNLSGLWILLVVFKIIPTFISDSIYDVVAKNRYKWFGKSVCELPQNLEDTSRFL